MVVIIAESMMVYIWNWEPVQHPESGEEVMKRPGNDMVQEPRSFEGAAERSRKSVVLMVSPEVKGLLRR